MVGRGFTQPLSVLNTLGVFTPPSRTRPPGDLCGALLSAAATAAHGAPAGRAARPPQRSPNEATVFFCFLFSNFPQILSLKPFCFRLHFLQNLFYKVFQFFYKKNFCKIFSTKFLKNILIFCHVKNLFQKISIYDVSSSFFETFSSNVFLVICFSKKFFTLMMFKFLCLFFFSNFFEKSSSK